MFKSSAAMVSAALLIACGAGLAAEPVLLQYKFEKGDALRYRLEMKSTTSFSMPDGKAEQQTMTNSMELTQELIEAKADGSFAVAVSIEKAIQTINGKEQPSPAQPGRQIMTMLPSGKTIAAVGSDPGAAGQMQMIFPDKPIKEGESWEQAGRLAQPIPMETLTKYTLEKASEPFPPHGNAARVKSEMAINSTKGEGGEQVSSNTKGTLHFDTVKGRMLRSQASSNFKFNLPIQLPGVPNAQNVKVNLDMDLEISLVEGGKSGGGEKPPGDK